MDLNTLANNIRKIGKPIKFKQELYFFNLECEFEVYPTDPIKVIIDFDEEYTLEELDNEQREAIAHKVSSIIDKIERASFNYDTITIDQAKARIRKFCHDNNTTIQMSRKMSYNGIIIAALSYNAFKNTFEFCTPIYNDEGYLRKYDRINIPEADLNNLLIEYVKLSRI